MSSDFELDLDLEFLPEWARQPSTEVRVRRAEGRRGPARGRERGRRGGRRTGRPPAAQARPAMERREPRRRTPLPDVEVDLVPDPRGVETLVRQIRFTGRSYPLFDIGRLILQKPERYSIVLSVKKRPNGQPIQSLYVCSVDQSIWLSEDEVVQYVLDHHFETFYKIHKVPQEPPKGNYTFVAQCGYSGEILGPPNYHEYQKRLQELHARRFSHIPFEQYKARVRIIKDEEAVKKWIESMSYREEYETLNVPEPQRLTSRQEVEEHFRQVYLPNIATAVDRISLPAQGPFPPMSRGLRILIDRTLERERRFPISLVRNLSQQFASHGLHFFKVRGNITHVCVSKPQYLDLETTVVSDRIRRIIEYIRDHPGCTRVDLIAALAPAPNVQQAAAQIPTAHVAQSVEQQAQQAATKPAEATEGAQEAPKEEAQESKAKLVLPEEPTEEQKALIADLYWLIHQGHVIEFTTGRLELPPKKKRPAQPQPKPEEAKKQETKPEETKEEAKPETEQTEKAEAAQAEQPTASDSEQAEQPAEPPAKPEASAEGTPSPESTPQAGSVSSTETATPTSQEETPSAPEPPKSIASETGSQVGLVEGAPAVPSEPKVEDVGTPGVGTETTVPASGEETKSVSPEPQQAAMTESTQSPAATPIATESISSEVQGAQPQTESTTSPSQAESDSKAQTPLEKPEPEEKKTEGTASEGQLSTSSATTPPQNSPTEGMAGSESVRPEETAQPQPSSQPAEGEPPREKPEDPSSSAS